jgi:hypothetical protein
MVGLLGKGGHFLEYGGMAFKDADQFVQGIGLRHEIGEAIPVIHLEQIKEIAVDDELHFAALVGSAHVVIQKIYELVVGGEILQQVLTSVMEPFSLPHVKVADNEFNFF